MQVESTSKTSHPIFLPVYGKHKLNYEPKLKQIISFSFFRKKNVKNKRLFGGEIEPLEVSFSGT